LVDVILVALRFRIEGSNGEQGWIGRRELSPAAQIVVAVQQQIASESGVSNGLAGLSEKLLTSIEPDAVARRAATKARSPSTS